MIKGKKMQDIIVAICEKFKRLKFCEAVINIKTHQEKQKQDLFDMNATINGDCEWMIRVTPIKRKGCSDG